MSHNGEQKLYAIAGDPVMHSLSPEMHNAAFRRLGIDARYLRLACDTVLGVIGTAVQMGLSGLNLTMPYKKTVQEACRLLDLDQKAKKAGAVNTILIDGEQLKGTNTDIHGVKASLEHNGVTLHGIKAIILGAGGAARAAVLALKSAGSSVVIVNRNEKTGIELAGEFDCRFQPLTADGLKKAARGASVVLGCTSTPGRIFPKELLKPSMTVMDAYYASESALVKDAMKAGCKVVDGREWLLHQGAEAFREFTGLKAPIDVMREVVYAGHPANPKNRTVILVGLMGTGKSTVAEEIGRLVSVPVRNMDKMIERRARMSVSEIFKNFGEAGFRRMETELLESIFADGPAIIDSGGGIVVSEHNRSLIRKHATVVWLWTDPAIIASRLEYSGDLSRPLLKGTQRTETVLQTILHARKRMYAEVADLVVGPFVHAEAMARRIVNEAGLPIKSIG